jgi:hypothetical protein
LSKKDFFQEPTTASQDRQILERAASDLAQLRKAQHREKLQFFWKSIVGLSLASGALAWMWRLQKAAKPTSDDSITMLSLVDSEPETLEGSLVLAELELDQESENARDEVFDDLEFLVGMTEEDWQLELSASTTKES